MSLSNTIHIVIFLTMFSCSEGGKSHTSLRALETSIHADKAYVQEFKKETSPTHIQVMYQPTDVLVSRTLGGISGSKATVDSLRANFKKFIYFQVRVSVGQQDLERYLAQHNPGYIQQIQLFTTQAQPYFAMHVNGEETLPVHVLYQRSFGTDVGSTFMVLFERQSIQNASTFDVHCKLLPAGIPDGNSSFTFTTDDILNEPTLTFTHNI